MPRPKLPRPHDPAEPHYARVLAVLSPEEQQLLTTLPGLLIDRIDVADKVIGFGGLDEGLQTLETEALPYLAQLMDLARVADARLRAARGDAA
jgi:hypothetical protein